MILTQEYNTCPAVSISLICTVYEQNSLITENDAVQSPFPVFGGEIKIKSKTLPEVVGELCVRPVINAVFRAIKAGTETLTKIINCTPHDVKVYDEDGENIIAIFPKSNCLARLSQNPQQPIGELEVDGIKIPVIHPVEFGEPEGMPPCDKNDCPGVIVSRFVAEKLLYNKECNRNVFIPATGPGSAVRSKSGDILGTKSLIQYCSV